MRNFGIICEFNPLHNGHKLLIEHAKSMGADRIVCVMSGNAVQRGELAVFDKYARAEAAILCGADLVIELPYPWSAASAEYFSRAGIEIASNFCDSIVFGSECGDIDKLRGAASVASKKSFREKYRERLENGQGAASAYFELLAENGFDGLSSNDLLGIEYIRAAIEKQYALDFYTLKREGAAYSEELLTGGQYQSATAIRNAWSEGNRDTDDYIPKELQRFYKEHLEEGRFTDFWLLSRAILMYFRLAEPEAFANVAEADGGIANRICALARECADEEELFERLKTKRYTDAKLRRAMLFCLTSVEKALLDGAPAYTTLLGANEKGRELLNEIRKDGRINIVTKPADAPKDTEQFKVNERLDSMFTLALAESTGSDESYRKKAFII